MAPSRIVLWASLGGLVLCLAAGAWQVNVWFALLAALGAAVLWGAAVYKPYQRWVANLALVATCAAAVAGVLSHAPDLLMIFAAGFGLVAWDVLLLAPSEDEAQDLSFDDAHLRALLLSVGGGLLAVLLGYFIRINVSFWLVLAAVLVALISLERLWTSLRKRN
jgi:hypothetical protein